MREYEKKNDESSPGDLGVPGGKEDTNDGPLDDDSSLSIDANYGQKADRVTLMGIEDISFTEEEEGIIIDNKEENKTFQLVLVSSFRKYSY